MEAMRQTNVSDLKARLSEYLAAVRNGETVVVHDRRTPIARLVPFEQQADELQVAEPTRPLRRGVALIFATHDTQQATAARALGFTCIGV
jgi:prevent-host-death family protein